MKFRNFKSSFWCKINENVGILIEINPECALKEFFSMWTFSKWIMQKVDDLKNFQMTKILEFWKILKKLGMNILVHGYFSWHFCGIWNSVTTWECWLIIKGVVATQKHIGNK